MPVDMVMHFKWALFASPMRRRELTSQQQQIWTILMLCEAIEMPSTPQGDKDLLRYQLAGMSRRQSESGRPPLHFLDLQSGFEQEEVNVASSSLKHTNSAVYSF